MSSPFPVHKGRYITVLNLNRFSRIGHAVWSLFRKFFAHQCPRVHIRPTYLRLLDDEVYNVFFFFLSEKFDLIIDIAGYTRMNISHSAFFFLFNHYYSGPDKLLNILSSENNDTMPSSTLYRIQFEQLILTTDAQRDLTARETREISLRYKLSRVANALHNSFPRNDCFCCAVYVVWLSVIRREIVRAFFSTLRTWSPTTYLPTYCTFFFLSYLQITRVE